MQISFNPLIHAEREAVIKFLGLDTITVTHTPVTVHLPAGGSGGGPGSISPADNPETGAASASAVPLPPPVAPLPAAADLFSTAPAVPPAGAAVTPIVPSPPVPPVPTSAAAPSTPATPPALAGGVEVDATGLPWDGRIHAESRTKNKDNTWRQRRNLDPAVLAAVTAELRGVMAIPAGGAPAAVVPPPPVPNVPAVPPTSAPVTVPTPTPPVPPAPTAAAPIAPATGGEVSFSSVISKITSNVTARKLTEAQVHEVLASVGLGPGQIGMLASRPDLLPAVDAGLNAKLQ